jgi:hypothetical protein
MELTCPPDAPMAKAHTASAAHPAWVRWFVPDLALLASIITLVFCLVFFDGTVELFRDSDAGWHIRNGERILSGAGLPRTDTWSMTRQGQPWFAWEWGADVLGAWFHQHGGLAWVAAFYALAISAATWVWFRLHWAVGGHFLIAGVMTTLLLSTGNIHWLARPHVLSWVLIVGAILMIETGRRSLLGLALLSVIWTNIHASFFLLSVVLCVYAADRFLRSVLWSGFDRPSDWKDARWFVTAAAVCFAASFVNPYGWEVHRHILHYLGDRELLDRIGEFQSFNFRVVGATQILASVVLTALGGVLALTQKRLSHFLLCALFFVKGLESARVLPLLSMICLPLADGAIVAALKSWTGLQPWVRRQLDDFVQYGANLRLLDKHFHGAALVPIIVAVVFWGVSQPAVAARASFPPATFPVKACAGPVANLPVSAKLLAPDLYGGYLIYRFNGSRKVWFDGRSDFYGAKFMQEYIDTVEVRKGARERIVELGFTHALLPNRYSLIPALEALGWKRLYADETATLLEAPQRRKD